MGLLVIFIQKAVGQGVGILYGALGEMMTRKSDNLNLGIPGMIYMDDIAGLIRTFLYENGTTDPSGLAELLASFMCAFVCAALGRLVCSVLTITLRANRNVTDLTLTTFNVGFGDFFDNSLAKLTGSVGQISVAVTDAAYETPVPGLSELGVIEQIFFSYGFLTYLAVVLALALAFSLTKTREGLNPRTVGEGPTTADAVDTNVTAYKYLATCLGGSTSGLDGLYFVMEYSGGIWTNNELSDRGWLAITLVVFALWKPVGAIWGSILFGSLYTLYLYIPGLDRGAQKIFKVLPYVVTIVVLVITSLRKRREYQPLRSLGPPYLRERRQGFERQIQKKHCVGKQTDK